MKTAHPLSRCLTASWPADMPYELPAEIDPPRISVCVPVPDDENHKRAFLGQIGELAKWWTWDFDETRSKARESATVWLDIYLTVADRLWAGEECGGGMDCCDELLDAIRDLKNTTSSGSRLAAYDGTVTSINADAPGVRFDSADADQTDPVEHDLRLTALCLAARQYVYGTMGQAHATFAAAAGIAGTPAAIAFLFGGPLGAIVGAIVLIIAAYTYQQVLDAASDSDMLEEVVCDLYNALRGRPSTTTGFQDAVNSLDNGSGTRATAVGLMKAWRTKEENYLYLIDLLGNGYTQAEAGAVNDCCDDENLCTVTWDFRTGSHGWWIQRGDIAEGEGIRCNGPGSDGQQRWLDATIELGEPCSDTHMRLQYFFTTATGRYHNAQFRRASDGAWTSADPFGSNSAGEWNVKLAIAPTHIPFDAIRIRMKQDQSNTGSRWRSLQIGDSSI